MNIRKIFAMLLAVVMLLGMLPTAALAEEPVYAQSDYTTAAPLPEEVLSDLETSGIKLENVYDFTAYNGFRSQGGTYDKAVEDEDSDFGKAFMYDPWADGTYNSTFSMATYGAMNFRSGGDWGAGVLGSISKESLAANADNGYNWYKVEDMLIPEKGISPYLTGVWGWSFQFNGANALLDQLAGTRVDMFVRIKIEGDMDNTTDSTKTAKYYFDRFIFTAACGKHFEGVDWVLVSAATCTDGSVEKLTCSECGEEKTRVNEDAFGHAFGEFVVNPATGLGETTCTNCGYVKYDLPENLLTKLPQSVLQDLTASGTGMEHVYDFGVADFTVGGIASVKNDPESPLGKAAVLNAWDYANPIVYMYYTNSTTDKRMSITDNTGRVLGEFSSKELNVEFDEYVYRTYKLEDVTLITDGFTRLHMLNGDIQNGAMAQKLSHLKDEPVDLYISMKIFGHSSSSSEESIGPVYYVDRMIVVDSCEDADCDCTKYVPKDCTVTFDANDGSGSMASVELKEFDTFTLPQCGFAAPTDMSFYVWKVGKERYLPGETITILGDTTVTAVWDSSVVDQAYFEDFEPALRFIVASDSHIHDAWTQTEEARLEQFFTTAYDYAESQNYQNVDGAFMVGDLTDTGTVVAHEKFFNIFNGATREGTTTGVVMGNHEFYSSNYNEEISIERFLNASGYTSTDNHLVIDGYHFILVSCCGGGGRTFAYDQMQWLDEEIQKAIAEDPTGSKPVFVFHHQSAAKTLAGTYGEFGNWELNWVLSKYPQVVTFNGHTHNPVSDPRSVWQGTFTAIGTGTLSYYGVAMGGIEEPSSWCPTDEEGGYAGRTIRDGSQYLIVEVDANNAIRVQTYELDTNEIVNEPVLIRSVGDADKFIYTNEREYYSVAPEFPADAAVTLEDVDITLAKLRFSQAKDEEDYVANYRVDLYQGTELIQSIKRLGCYFYEPTPTTLTAPFTGLEGGTEYTAKIYALNAWGKESAPLTYTFSTKSSNIIADEVFALGYDENGTAVNTVDGAELTGGNTMENFGDHGENIAARGITMEAYAKPGSQTVILGNDDFALKVVDGIPQFVTRWGTAAASAAITTDDYVHLVGAVDGEFVYLYVNGKEAAKTAISGTVTVSAQTLTVGSDITKAEVRSSVISAKQVNTNYEALAKDLIFRLGFDADLNPLNAIDGEKLTVFGKSELPVVADGAASFDTTNGYAFESFGNHYDDMLQSVTFEVKVTMDSLSGTVLPLSDMEGGGLGIQIVNGVPEFAVNIGGTYYKAKATKAMTAGTETHLAGTYDGQYIRMYVDGVEVGATAATGDFKLPNSKYAYYLGIGTDAIGTANRQASSAIDGTISDARVYTRALSAAEIAEIGTPPTHTIAGYKWNKTASQYEAACTDCGKTVASISRLTKPLPEGVLNDINAAGIGLEHVFDFGPTTMQPATTTWTDYPAALVEDAESVYGQAMRLAAEDAAKPAGYIMTKGETFGTHMSVLGTIGTWTYDDLKPNEGTGYQLYKFEDITYPSSYSQWFGFLYNHAIRIYNKFWNASSSFRGRQIDLYVSMKIEGELETDPVYYVDRVIIVESCNCEEKETECHGYLPTKYTVNFDANGGTGTMASVEKQEYSTYILPECTFTAKNKEFVGWKIGEKEYAVNDRIVIDGDVTVTALWVETVEEIPYQFTTSMTASLELESEVFLNVAPQMTDLEGNALTTAEAQAIEGNVGMLIWDAATAPAEEDATIDVCDNIILGATYNTSNKRFDIKSAGIAAKNLGDSLTIRAFYKDGDQVIYGKYVAGYSPKKYCYNQITKAAATKDVCIALLNYGAAAQVYFGHNTENMMNSELTAAQQTIAWTDDLVRSTWTVDAAKEGDLTRQNPPVNSRAGTLELEGAINVVFTGGATSITVDKAQLLIWTEADFEANDVLTAENATEVVDMNLRSDGKYEYTYTGVPAKGMFDVIYACQMYTDAEGNVYYGGVLPFCAERYGYMNYNKTDAKVANLAKTMIVYGAAARDYFG